MTMSLTGGSLVDLSKSPHQIPTDLAVDTSVVVARFQAFFPTSLPHQARQTASFFGWLRHLGFRVVLPPTAYQELLHLAIRYHYESHLRARRESLAVRFGTRQISWRDLYKLDPSILQNFEPNLAQLQEGLIANNITIAGPEEMDSTQAVFGQRYRDILIHFMVTYGLDSSDASILLEAQCLGLNAIVTMDKDLQRALPDFDIYTWLS
jgi:predicted nucleic acid-binding protein